MRHHPIVSIAIAFGSLLTADCFAQAPQRFNYQGVARDAGGTPLADQSVGLRLRLRSGSPTGPVVYQETHSTTTNAQGLFTLQVGGGAGGSGFSSINWGAGSYYIQAELDPSGGTAYQDMGASQLLSVPYALYAGNGGGSLDASYDHGGAGAGRQITADAGALRIAGTDGLLVTGNFGSGADVELSGAGTRMFFHPKKGAFRAGGVGSLYSHVWNNENIGDYSVALGYNTEASGEHSIALGLGFASGPLSIAIGGTATGEGSSAFGPASHSNGYGSTAVGFGCQAAGTYSVAMGPAASAQATNSTAIGYYSRAEGQNSMAFGETTASCFAETSMGRYNTPYTPANPNVPAPTDRLFVIGNGTSSLPADAFTILNNGDTRIGNRGTFFSNLQEGQLNAGSQAAVNGNKKAVTLTFPNAFAYPANVRVLLTPVNEGTNNDVFILSVRSVTATNCVVEIFRADAAANTGWGQSLRINWVAWE